MHHFKEEDLLRRGKEISRIALKKTAIPSIFVQNKNVGPVNCAEELCGYEEDHGATQFVDILSETEIDSLTRQLVEEREKNEQLQQEIDKKSHLIQNLSNDLNKFQKNALAQFAVRAHQNVEVILLIDLALNKHYHSVFLHSAYLLCKFTQAACTVYTATSF